ncbi:uncharacterized protein LOC134724508 isoform X2 [Mytilus trossulus]|uniref:uncharacterized protein LOC134724508 isoform X2 n=1 Tax=Mytilus trossulus TaxID=6551 RepID=UPI00300577A3
MPGNCLQKLKFKCQMVDISGGSKNVLTKRCYSIRLNWYDAQQTCLQEKSYLPTYTPSNDICFAEKDVDEMNNWHNAFVKERIVWETENRPRFSPKCLAVELREDKNYTLLAVNCTDKYKALCVLKSTIVSSVLGFSKQEDIKTTPSNPADAVIFGSVGGVTGLLFVVALVIVFIKRSSILKKIQDSTQQNNSPLYENDIGLQQQVYQDLNPVIEDINSTYDVMHTNNSPMNEHDIGLENQVYQDLTPDREENNTPYDELHIKNK